jgi:hypothetical protein
MLETPYSLKSTYYIINTLVKSLRLVNQQETILIITLNFPLVTKFTSLNFKYKKYSCEYCKNVYYF